MDGFGFEWESLGLNFTTRSSLGFVFSATDRRAWTFSKNRHEGSFRPMGLFFRGALTAHPGGDGLPRRSTAQSDDTNESTPFPSRQ